MTSKRWKKSYNSWVATYESDGLWQVRFTLPGTYPTRLISGFTLSAALTQEEGEKLNKINEDEGSLPVEILYRERTWEVSERTLLSTRLSIPFTGCEF